MANYILSILKTQLMVVWSWGFNSPKALTNGLQFKVEGFIHKGWVKIIYNEGADLFDVTLLNSDMETKKEITGIYFDELVEVIDLEVEKVDNYENKVKQTYSLL